MANYVNRWSQIVRTPGAAQVLAHHPVEVPALNGTPPDYQERPGVRLLVRPIEPIDGPWAIDITSTQVNAMLEGFLATGRHVNLRLGWRSRGFGVLRKDTLHLRPLNPGE